MKVNKEKETSCPGVTGEISGGTKESASNKVYERVLIEACCGEKSLLCSTTKYSRKCLRIPIDQSLDFCSEESRKICEFYLKDGRSALWFSCPCTGGCGWQHINWYRGESAQKKILSHWQQFRRLWKHFKRIASEAIPKGVCVFVEWPSGCQYWRDNRVVQFLDEYQGRLAKFNGCMYGLRANHGPDAGELICKPWTVACFNSSLPDYLNVRCDGNHRHASCAGRNTRETEGYTPEIAAVVHNSLRIDSRRFKQYDIVVTAAISDQAQRIGGYAVPASLPEEMSGDPGDDQTFADKVVAAAATSPGKGQPRPRGGVRPPPADTWQQAGRAKSLDSARGGKASGKMSASRPAPPPIPGMPTRPPPTTGSPGKGPVGPSAEIGAGSTTPSPPPAKAEGGSPGERTTGRSAESSAKSAASKPRASSAGPRRMTAEDVLREQPEQAPDRPPAATRACTTRPQHAVDATHIK